MNIATSSVPVVAQMIWEPDANFIVQISVSEPSHVHELRKKGISHPAFSVVPRQCFLLTHTRSTASNFAQVSAAGSPMWLEHSEPLPTARSVATTPATAGPIIVPAQFPIGVVVDVLAALRGVSTAAFLKAESNCALKFRAIFSNDDAYFMRAMPVISSEQDASHLITHRFKQYLQLMYRDLNTIFTTVTTQLEEQRRKATLGNDAVEFYKARGSYLKHVSEQIGREAFVERQNFVVFYVHIVAEGKYNSTTVVVDARVDPTLLHLLHYHVPCCYGIESEVGRTPNAALHSPEIPVGHRFHVSVLGVSPILSTDVRFLREQMCAVDFFVHVVVAPSEAATIVEGRVRPERPVPTVERVAVATDDSTSRLDTTESIFIAPPTPRGGVAPGTASNSFTSPLSNSSYAAAGKAFGAVPPPSAAVSPPASRPSQQQHPTVAMQQQEGSHHSSESPTTSSPSAMGVKQQQPRATTTVTPPKEQAPSGSPSRVAAGPRTAVVAAGASSEPQPQQPKPTAATNNGGSLSPARQAASGSAQQHGAAPVPSSSPTKASVVEPRGTAATTKAPQAATTVASDAVASAAVAPVPSVQATPPQSTTAAETTKQANDGQPPVSGEQPAVAAASDGGRRPAPVPQQHVSNPRAPTPPPPPPPKTTSARTSPQPQQPPPPTTAEATSPSVPPTTSAAGGVPHQKISPSSTSGSSAPKRQITIQSGDI